MNNRSVPLKIKEIAKDYMLGNYEPSKTRASDYKEGLKEYMLTEFGYDIDWFSKDGIKDYLDSRIRAHSRDDLK